MRYVEGDDLRTLVRAEQRLEPGRAAYIVVPGGAGPRRRARARDRPPRRQARQRPARRQRPRLPHRLRADQARAPRRPAPRATGAGSARSATSRPSRSAASASTRAPTSTRWAACSTTRSPACRPISARATRRRCGRTSTTIRRSLHERAPDVPDSFDAVLARAMAKDPDDRFPSAGDLGRAAMAAAGQPVAPGPERVVAVGEAAPGDNQETVVSPDQAPTVLASGASARRRLWPWALAAVPIVGLALIAAFALGGDDGRRRRRHDVRVDDRHDHDGSRRRRRRSPNVDRRRASQQHRDGQRQGLGGAQRQPAARGHRRQDGQARALQPAGGQPPAARPPASGSCG